MLETSPRVLPVAFKGIVYSEIKIQSLSTHYHADGRSEEVFLGHVYTGAAPLKMEKSFQCVLKICPHLQELPKAL